LGRVKGEARGKGEVSGLKKTQLPALDHTESDKGNPKAAAAGT